MVLTNLEIKQAKKNMADQVFKWYQEHYGTLSKIQPYLLKQILKHERSIKKVLSKRTIIDALRLYRYKHRLMLDDDELAYLNFLLVDSYFLDKHFKFNE